MKGSRSGSGKVNMRCGRIKRKNMFMESNIFGNKKLLCGQIKKFVTFHSKRITNENTYNSSSIKLGSMRRKVRSISKTTKHFKMRISGSCVHQDFKRGFVLENRSRQPINNVGYMKYAFTPKSLWQIGLKSDSSSYIEQVLVLPFYNRVLL